MEDSKNTEIDISRKEVEDQEKEKKQLSYLQLFRFNLVTEEESLIEGFSKEEETCYLYPMINKNFGDSYLVL